MHTTYDVIVLGAGNAGQVVAGRARAAGRSVLVVEERDVGGTCPLRGCVPKKVLVAAAEAMHTIETAGVHHIETGPARLDWAKLMDRKDGFVEGVAASMEASLTKRGIDVVHGRARFAGRDAVAVDGTTYTGRRILISTGSKPRRLPIDGFEHTITSDEILNLREQPESLVFIGAGVIAMEFAHVFARAGTKVTLLEVAWCALPMLEDDFSAALAAETRRLGVALFTHAQTRSIAPDGDGFVVTFTHDGDTKTVRAAMIANGAGRVPAVDELDLEAAGIETDERGAILVDAHLRSVSNTDVFVAGDALAHAPQLSPVASYEGRVVAHNLLHDDLITPDYDSIPRVVYTVPSLASVGLTEAMAKERGLAVTVHENDMTDWRSSRTQAETAARAKVLVEEETGRLVGAHILGHGAQEIIHMFAFAMKYGVPADDLKDFVYAYPTFTSDIRFLV